MRKLVIIVFLLGCISCAPTQQTERTEFILTNSIYPPTILKIEPKNYALYVGFLIDEGYSKKAAEKIAKVECGLEKVDNEYINLIND